MKFSNALHSLMKVLLPSLAALFVATAGAQDLLKDHSVLYPESVAAAVRANVANDPWAASVRDRVVAAATFWHDKSDAELWELMFGPTLERSWMVWSNGYSPVTGKPVPMYNWVVDAQNHPWKTQDPTSGEWFPKNDFKAFYDSGLDERGLFAAQRADRSLLFNTDHPDPGDPQHLFGVDDGLGYVNEKGERWRFIGAYLIYGQWKQLVVAGVRVLSAAYLLTGDPAYAHKAGVLLDRIADLYPDFDFKTQGVLYEGPASAGYVSTWHDTCEETRELIMGYDMVFEALRNDAELVAFLSKRAAEIHLENPKASFVDIQRHIEGRILRDALAHPDKIHSNYPRSEILKAVTTAVLQEPEGAFWALVDPMLQQTTAVDGVTGEKGLAGYSSFTISALASFLSEFSKADPGFVARMLERCPELKKTYRFFIDTLCLQRYYPQIGDSGHYAAVMDSYVGIDFLKPGENIQGWGNWTLLCPSNYRFLWKLYELTNDPTYVQVLYWANGNKVDGLPYDIYGADPQQFRDSVAAVIEREGAHIALGSVNKQAWHLAILRSGRGANERALWLDYDAGGGHGHQDGMNLGLFAFGLDLSPEMGYPPVQFGGWGSPRARWYTMSAAHNTVVVDRVNQKNGAGDTTLWIDASRVHAIRARGSAMIDGERFERTAVLVDLDDDRFYVVDIFRVTGGQEHTKFQQSHFGTVELKGLALAPAEDFGHETQMRNFQLQKDAPPGWTAEWTIEDRAKLLPEPASLRMRYWDFTTGAVAGVTEAWIVPTLYEGSEEMWIPRVVVQRTAAGEAQLVSTFVAVLGPYRNTPNLAAVTRLALQDAQGNALGDGHVALDITRNDGGHDLLVLQDPENMAQGAAHVDNIETDAELAFARQAGDGSLTHAVLAKGRYCRVGERRFEGKEESIVDHAEFSTE